jgi:hypothetical protein
MWRGTRSPSIRAKLHARCFWMRAKPHNRKWRRHSILARDRLLRGTPATIRRSLLQRTGQNLALNDRGSRELGPAVHRGTTDFAFSLNNLRAPPIRHRCSTTVGRSSGWAPPWANHPAAHCVPGGAYGRRCRDARASWTCLRPAGVSRRRRPRLLAGQARKLPKMLAVLTSIHHVARDRLEGGRLERDLPLDRKSRICSCGSKPRSAPFFTSDRWLPSRQPSSRHRSHRQTLSRQNQQPARIGFHIF